MKNEKRRKNIQKGLLAALCAVLALVLCVMILVSAYAYHYLSLIRRNDDTDMLTPDQAATMTDPDGTVPSNFTGPTISPDDVTFPTHGDDLLVDADHIINILLIGQDRREDEPRQRSDSMILCTINTSNNTITLTSFLRDMYVDIPGYWPTKMNAAYAFGGMTTLKDTLYANFGVVVDGCVEVDFGGFEKVINLVGGVDIRLTAAEANHLNGNSGWSLVEGWNHLNGKQALAYSRIRALDNDFGRTQRQRNVLTSVFESCKNLSLTEVKDLLNSALPLLTTDMSNTQIINYVTELFPMLMDSQLQTLRIPADGTWQDAWIGTSAVLIVDFAANRQIIYNMLMVE